MNSGLFFSEFSNAEHFAGNLFRRKFASIPPEYPRNIGLFWKNEEGSFSLLTYVHLYDFHGVGLVGGVCTDGNQVRKLPSDVLNQIDRSPYYASLKHIFKQYHNCFEAFFGYCNDERALSVNLQAGFVETGFPNLIVHWHQDISEQSKQELTNKVHAIGPF